VNAAPTLTADRRRYVEGAPHLKHDSLRSLYLRLVRDVLDGSSQPPAVLDLGAGRGDASLPFLEAGARVTAVDESEEELGHLRSAGAAFGERLDLRCGDAVRIVSALESEFDVVVASSFLHHVPDYLEFVRSTLRLLRPGGWLLVFQEPLRYDSLSRGSFVVTRVAYAAWRVRQGDLTGGLRRRVRRARGIYREDDPDDSLEYHAIRGGVDHDALVSLLEREGLSVRSIRYFSTQSRVFQRLGERLGLESTFALVARQPAHARSASTSAPPARSQL
jgi:SAM-dependent methyltransferase